MAGWGGISLAWSWACAHAWGEGEGEPRIWDKGFECMGVGELIGNIGVPLLEERAQPVLLESQLPLHFAHAVP